MHYKKSSDEQGTRPFIHELKEHNKADTLMSAVDHKKASHKWSLKERQFWAVDHF